MIDILQAQRDLLDENLGFTVARQLYTASEIDSYREYCERFLRTGTHIRQRIMTRSMEDYIHPRSHDRKERTARIYQYFHNHQGDVIGQFLRRAMDIRNEVEAAWLEDPVYRSEKATLLDYVIVTQYYGNQGMLPKHVDYDGPAPKPLVQFWLALTEPGKDYSGGNLVLYSKNGRSRRVETDLQIRKGDALLFDKSLPHEVELTQVPDSGGLGRWTALIGARAAQDTAIGALRKRLLWGPPLYPALHWVSQNLKRAS